MWLDWCDKAVLSFLLLQTSSAYAMSCEVEYRAERKVPERAWVIDIDRLEVSSGKVQGSGDTLDECRQDALNQLTKDGWKITYSGKTVKI